MAEQPHGPSNDPRRDDAPDATRSDAADDQSQTARPPASGGYSGAGARSPQDFPGQSSFQPLAPPSYDAPPAPTGPAGQPVSRRAATIMGISVGIIVLVVIIWAFASM